MTAVREPAPRRLERATLAAEGHLQRLATHAGRPWPGKVLRAAGFAGAAVVLALFAFGTAMLGTLVPGGYVALGVIALAVVPLLLDWKLPHVRVVHVPVVAVIAVVVPVVTLLGADVVWATAGLPRLAPAAGLLIAAALVAGTAYGYLRWIREAPPPYPAVWAFYAGAAAVGLTVLTGARGLGVGLVVAALGAGVATLIYLLRAAEPDIGRPLWGGLLIADVMLVVLPLFIEAVRAGSVSVILLLGGAAIAVVAGVNGLWIPGDAASRRRTRWALGLGIGVAVVAPVAVAVIVHARSSPPPEGPVPRAAAASPLPAAALAHMPVLRFDGGETLRTPLDVDAVLRTGDVSQCPHDRLLGGCVPLSRADDLRVGFGNLAFDTRQVAGVGATTIYVHPVPDPRERGWTDLDYWWYLPDNPAATARGAMCGAGLVIPEITCFDHQSDWEGVTVVVDRAGAVQEVHYAAHADVVSYTWEQLLAKWHGRDVAGHPQVYIARGTHAAYPVACHDDPCAGNALLEDNRHDGRFRWICPRGCVTAFPQTAAREPATWNAFDGLWGSANCLAGAYCSRSDPPASPAQQPRFAAPWCSDFHQVGPRLKPWQPDGCSPAELRADLAR